ncbi:MAG TPA: inositol monophosphatase family protein [Solirubrobacteraceae bacterium]|nr:inositol monophosphatase family protein [Solirubrobacteraceae bacterium]
MTELLALAESVAREAGAQLREAFARVEELRIATKSSATDLVSDADLAAERLIRERLSAARPDDALLGEEGSDVAGTSGLRWVVDPLDGTVNFLFGIPQWCVSVAVEDDAGVLAGVVFDAERDELWAATRDGPATLNGAAFDAPGREDLATAMVATGFGYAPEVRRTQAALVSRLLPEVRDIRRLGAAALDLVWTAAGRYDAYFERGLNHWDVAAGELVCARAGLSVVPLPPSPPSGAGVLVASARLASALRPLLD